MPSHVPHCKKHKILYTKDKNTNSFKTDVLPVFHKYIASWETSSAESSTAFLSINATCHMLIWPSDSLTNTPTLQIAITRETIGVFLQSKLMEVLNTCLEFPYNLYGQLPKYYPSPCMWHHYASQLIFYTSPVPALYTAMYTAWLTFVESGISQR